MIGHVHHRHALLEILFRIDGQPDVPVECVIDTGFTDALCLPADVVANLALPYQFDFPASLADGSLVVLPVHEGTILWNGLPQRVHILATGDRPLIGTTLLDGTELLVRFSEGGLVSVKPLSAA